MATPYITVAMLLNAPTGASWEIVPEPDADTEAQFAELTNVCWRATSIIDTYCNQVLRGTVDTEQLTGPGSPRVGLVPGTDITRLILKRWPVTQILAVATSPSRSFPRAWSLVPAGMYDIEHPLINSLTDTASATTPDGGWSVQVAPGYIPPLRCGRNSSRIEVSYVNGWPHTSLTAAASIGDTVLHVDDVTGFAGAQAFVYDGGITEPVAVLSVAATTPLVLPNGAGTAQTGPGTVTLATGLANPHAAGVVVSSLPANVLWAAALAAASQALEAGITGLVVAATPGTESEGGHGVEDLVTEYEVLLQPFRRIA